MKNKLIACCISGSFWCGLFSQEIDSNQYLGKIYLYVAAIENAENLSHQQISKLESKITLMATKNGIAGLGYSGNFILYPKFEIFNITNMEGMQNMAVLDVELNLFIKQKSNNVVFSSYNKRFHGSGYNKDEAINNAISQINPDDKDVRDFIEEGKNKIIQFYNSKCSDIIAEADRYAGMNDFARALAVLISVPVEAIYCNQEIKGKSISIYKLYLQKQCQSVMLLAKAQIAGNRYLAGLRTLSTIDPTSNCYKEAQAMIKSAEGEINIEEQKIWEFEKEKMKTKAELEKTQWGVVSNIASSFFTQTPGLMGTILNFLF